MVQYLRNPLPFLPLALFAQSRALLWPTQPAVLRLNAAFDLHSNLWMRGTSHFDLHSNLWMRWTFHFDLHSNLWMCVTSHFDLHSNLWMRVTSHFDLHSNLWMHVTSYLLPPLISKAQCIGREITLVAKWTSFLCERQLVHHVINNASEM
jgi:plasmid maintenance system antidote protein VapI